LCSLVLFDITCHFPSDVDHPGVTNAELIKEGAKVAETYNDKSISEQNSVDLAWYLFMDERYSALRGVIYHDEAELKRFRQFIVNAVMATDIADKDLKILRDTRWENAFSEGSPEENQEILNRKATVMIDCLLQASDIAVRRLSRRLLDIYGTVHALTHSLLLFYFYSILCNIGTFTE